jgi:HK97 family phage major capsid protein/HK97 family phage prohead protease
MSLELKFSADSATVIGYGSLFNGAPDAAGDLVAPGAFVASLASGLPAMLREHKGAPVGRWTSAREDELGLRVEGIVTDAATITDLRAGRLDGLSIGFHTLRSKSADGSRVLQAVQLEEISFVQRPCKSSARVLSVKSAVAANREGTMPDTNTAAGDNCSADNTTLETRVAAVETGLSDLSTRLGKIEEATTSTAKAVKSLDTVLRRPGAAAPTAETKAADDSRAFFSFVRRGVERIEPLEAKSLRVSDSTAGGFLAPEQFVQELLRNVVLFSPIRGLARVSQTGSANVQLPKRTGTLTGHWVEETGARTATSPEYGQAQFPVKELACYVDVSNQLLEDSAFDIASELATDFAEEFGKLEGTAFVSGDGVGKPFGFMSDTALSFTASGHASQVTADGLIALYYALAPAYRANAAWVMNSATLAKVRQLKDPSTGSYLLIAAGTLAGAPTETLLGRPVVEAVDMPDIAGNSFPIALGDFKAGYRIFDRVALSVLRDPYSVATSGLVRFHARRRLAAGVAKAEAIRKLKIAA